MKVLALFSSLVVAACTPSVKQVLVEPADSHLAAAAATASLRATAKDEKGTPVAGVKVAWSSSNPGIATVDDTGKVTAVKSGSAEIAATAGDVKGVAHVQVQILHSLDLSSLRLNAPSQAAQMHLLAKDDAGHEMVAASPTWSSSNAKIATVDAAGNVRAVEPGTATITVRVGELTASAAVTVATAMKPTAVKPKTSAKKRHG